MNTPTLPTITLSVIYIKDLDVYNAVYEKSSSIQFWLDENTPLPLSYSNKSVLLDKESLNKVKYCTTTDVSVEYKNTLTGEQFSREQYLAKKESLTLGYDEDTEEWDSIDSEYAYKKWDQGWEVVRHTETSWHSPEIKVVEVQVSTGSKYIVPVWAVDTLPDEKRLYTLNVAAKALATFKAVCVKHEMSYNIPTHSGLTYAKVGDKYVWGNGSPFATSKWGTLEDMQQAERDIEAEVERAVCAKIAEIKGVLLDNATIGDALNKAKSVRTLILEMDVKQKSASSRAAALNILSGFITALETQAVRELDKQ